ncbi:MAG: HPF/RaiA family ribosome-associated protein [Planctomycetota bacterium]|jgi:ribosome-associated translation inhibitor RaiA|nr:HPF/RaiA family ribosome-associated protein [Planctomycetota bacterium]MDP6988269.1 HPF/RaiA family ribosome-associated protein [Planctomycetota bacterium]
MNTEVSILHHDYPSHVRETVDERLQNLQKYYNGTVAIRALLERQADEHRVEIVTRTAKGPTLVVDSRAETFGNALDEALSRMTRLLKREHDLHTTVRRRPHRSAS